MVPTHQSTLRLVPLGDQAMLIYFDDEEKAFRGAEAIRSAGFPWLADVVPAYLSVGVFFRPSLIGLDGIRQALALILSQTSTAALVEGRLRDIPCCYEMELDLRRVAEHSGLPRDEVIRLHLGTEYRVYAVGFAPGFPYLGYLPESLSGVPRLPTPRLKVEPGSVGLTARQTGIYPLARPGGWNLIGRTPLILVDVADEYFPLRVGDRVRFVRIDEIEYQQMLGKRFE